MILEGTYQLRVQRQKLWDFIIDPNKIGKCLPDLKSLNVEDEDTFMATVRVGVGFIKADYKFKIEILEKAPPERVRLKATGSAPGSSIIIDTMIELKDDPAGSQLNYKSDTKIAGTVAALGQRVIKDTAEKTIAGVFDCVRLQVE